MFALFAGESWGYVGSRKLVADMTNFTCDVDEDDGTCREPFTPSYAFKQLHMDNIHRLLEVSQIGINTTRTITSYHMSYVIMSWSCDIVRDPIIVYLHREHDVNPATDAFATDIMNAAAGLQSTLQTSMASTSTPGVPPSSSQAFLRASPSLPTIVLADHDQHYTNKYTTIGIAHCHAPIDMI